MAWIQAQKLTIYIWMYAGKVYVIDYSGKAFRTDTYFASPAQPAGMGNKRGIVRMEDIILHDDCSHSKCYRIWGYQMLTQIDLSGMLLSEKENSFESLPVIHHHICFLGIFASLSKAHGVHCPINPIIFSCTIKRLYISLLRSTSSLWKECCLMKNSIWLNWVENSSQSKFSISLLFYMTESIWTKRTQCADG